MQRKTSCHAWSGGNGGASAFQGAEPNAWVDGGVKKTSGIFTVLGVPTSLASDEKIPELRHPRRKLRLRSATMDAFLALLVGGSWLPSHCEGVTSEVPKLAVKVVASAMKRSNDSLTGLPEARSRAARSSANVWMPTNWAQTEHSTGWLHPTSIYVNRLPVCHLNVIRQSCDAA